MGKPKTSVVAAAAVAAPANDLEVAAGKKAKRQLRQNRAGIHISVRKCEKAIAARWKGQISSEAPVALAALLNHITATLYRDAAVFADKGLTRHEEEEDGGEEESKGKNGKHRITGGDIQAALTTNIWLRRNLIKGTVVGAAPVTRQLNNPPSLGGGAAAAPAADEE